MATTLALISEREAPHVKERRQRMLGMAACCRSRAQEITAKGDEREH